MTHREQQLLATARRARRELRQLQQELRDLRTQHSALEAMFDVLWAGVIDGRYMGVDPKELG